jgi:phosphate transport system permease protein
MTVAHAASEHGLSGSSRGSGRVERVLPHALRALAVVPLVALLLIVAELVVKALPAIKYNGAGFFTSSDWSTGSLYANPVTTGGVTHPVGASYGVLPMLIGTLESSAIALVLAVPVAVGTAMIVVEKLPARLSSTVGFCLEVLAGVPSVVYGLWGVLTLGPFLAKHLSGFASHIPDVPVLSFFRGPTGYGEGLLPSAIVLAIMVVPIIAATTRDLLRQVPRATIEGAEALGMTDSEAIRAVTFPWVRSGVIGASMLGLGRALGETIAVAMISGVILGTTPHTIFSTFSTIAATIVTQLDGALTDGTGFAVSALAEIALVLLVITLITNIGARLLVRRVATTALPVGRGI